MRTTWDKANKACSFANSGREWGWLVSPTPERKLTGRQDYCFTLVQHRTVESNMRSLENQVRANLQVCWWEWRGLGTGRTETAEFSVHQPPSRTLDTNQNLRKNSEVNRTIPTLLMGKWSLGMLKWPGQGQMLTSRTLLCIKMHPTTIIVWVVFIFLCYNPSSSFLLIFLN